MVVQESVLTLEQKIATRQAVVGVVGLGNIGLSLLDAFGQNGFPLVGYDVDTKKVEMLKTKKSYINHLDMEPLFRLIENDRFKVSDDPSILKSADVIIISVATTLDEHGNPNLSNLLAAFKAGSKYFKNDQLIVVQSSTYPGTTEEELLPLLEKSQLKVGKDIFLAYVPEVCDFGNQDFTFCEVPRIIGGITPECVKLAKLLYEQAGCKTVPVSSPRIAEAAKLLQNAYRLINISFINEMKILFDHMGINVWEVIEAAKTKPFGFAPFYPGPGIGGDCIPVVPFYLVWNAKACHGPSTMLEQAGHIDDMMVEYVLNKLMIGLNRFHKAISEAKILVLGVAYKKDVNDIRESPAIKLMEQLKKMDAKLSYHDPLIDTISHVKQFPDLNYKSINLNYDQLDSYDAVIIITDHSTYDWNKIVSHSKLVIDTRNVTANIPDPDHKIIKA